MRRRRLEQVLGDGGYWLWEDAGEPVSMTGVSPAPPGGARVGPVYTPRPLRGRGYATALVAHVSAEALAARRRRVLPAHRHGQPHVERHLHADRLRVGVRGGGLPVRCPSRRRAPAAARWAGPARTRSRRGRRGRGTRGRGAPSRSGRAASSAAAAAASFSCCSCWTSLGETAHVRSAARRYARAGATAKIAARKTTNARIEACGVRRVPFGVDGGGPVLPLGLGGGSRRRPGAHGAAAAPG